VEAFMLNIRIVCVGKLKERFYADAAKEYMKRLSGYCKLEVIEIPEHRIQEGREGRLVENSQFTIHDSQFVSHKPQPSTHNPQSTIISGGSRGHSSQVAIALEKERIAVEGKVPSGAVRVALCVEGREMDSRGLSDFLAGCSVRGASRLCFMIGGSFGLHEDIKDSADVKLSMSKMTFPHNLARVMLLEQLYRAFKITEGGKYHK